MTPVIDIAVEDDAWRVIADLDSLVGRAVTAALAVGRQASVADIEISVVLSDDSFVQALNAKWRGKDKPTNVLSFPVDIGRMSPALGDIVVAYETCRREAEEERRDLGDYLSHLIVHGVFHLLGFDHENDLDAEAMEALETQALKTLGIVSPYECTAELSPPT